MLRILNKIKNRYSRLTLWMTGSAAFLNVFSDNSRLPIPRNTNDLSLDIISLLSWTDWQFLTNTSTVPFCSGTAFTSRNSFCTWLMVNVKFEFSFFICRPCGLTVTSANPVTLNERSLENTENVRPEMISLQRLLPFSSTATRNLFKFLLLLSDVNITF